MGTKVYALIVFWYLYKLVHLIGFEEFASNVRIKNLVEKYFRKEIKTRGELLEKLDEIGVEITLRTLERHLAKMKKSHKSVENLEDMENAELGMQMNTANLENLMSMPKICTYLVCNVKISKKTNPTGRTTTAILREGKLDRTHKIIHHPICSGQPLEKLTAEQLDRSQRRDIAQCSSDVKTIWREGSDRAREHDVAEDVEIDDSTGLSFNYPKWQSVRRAYNRRKQQNHQGDSSDPFDIPDRLQMTKHGAIKLVLRKELTPNDMWLQFRNKDLGVMLFMTNTQKIAATRCKILVADGTFELSPLNFQQIWTIHGLLETDNGAEWTPLLMSLMQKRTQVSYAAILSAVIEKWGESTLNGINRIPTDYEIGEITALKEAFGEQKVYGCIVHYIRTVMHHIKSNFPILFREFNRQEEIWKWVRRCFALPFLRKIEVKKKCGLF